MILFGYAKGVMLQEDSLAEHRRLLRRPTVGHCPRCYGQGGFSVGQCNRAGWWTTGDWHMGAPSSVIDG